MASYGIDRSRGVARFTEGLRAGLFDARAARRDEMQMEGMQEDREYLRGQRDRESKIQALQDEAMSFSKDIKNALGAYMASAGANYQPIVELYNKRYPSQYKLSVSRNDDGTLNVGAVDEAGKPVGKMNKATFDEFGVLASTIANPDAYFQNKLKHIDQKGRFSESERGITDTATGRFAPHGRGMGKKTKEQIESEKFQRLLTNDAVSILQSHFGGRFEGGMWFPDEENKGVAMNAIEMAADLIKEGEQPQRAANIAAEKAKQGALPKSRRTAAPGTAAPGKQPSDPDSYFKALRSAPQNQNISDEELRAYVNQKFQTQ